MNTLSLAERAEIELAEARERNPDPESPKVPNARNGTMGLPVVTDVAGLLAARFPPKVRLLSPWLTSQSLSMIYAARGLGKTHMAVGIAFALASGGEFLGWSAPKPVGVLYLDGEMAGADLQGRIEQVIKTNGGEFPAGLKFMTPDQQPNGIMPNLYTSEGRDAVEAVLGDARVIVVDNLSCLVRGGKENEGESWKPIQEWALRMRADGRSVLFVHHAGKGGQQRGTSGREDVLDTVIAMRKPSDYEAEQGARFEVHFEKARSLFGNDIAPFEAWLKTTSKGVQAWDVRPVTEASDERILECLKLGMSASEVVEETGISRTTFYRRKDELIAKGEYQPKASAKGKPKRTSPTAGADYRTAAGGE